MVSALYFALHRNSHCISHNMFYMIFTVNCLWLGSHPKTKELDTYLAQPPAARCWGRRCSQVTAQTLLQLPQGVLQQHVVCYKVTHNVCAFIPAIAHFWFFYLKFYWISGVPMMVQGIQIQLVSNRMRVQSLASLSGSEIQHCHEL